jgi:PPOX class probable F420-dependent enzyme
VATLTPEQGGFFREGNIATAATIRRDGSPHLTPVWIDWDDDDVLFNTVEGRVKERNIERNPAVAVLVVDPENASRWISVSGSAALVEEGAEEHMNELSLRYRGRGYDHDPSMKRVIVRIKPERVTARGI